MFKNLKEKLLGDKASVNPRFPSHRKGSDEILGDAKSPKKSLVSINDFYCDKETSSGDSQEPVATAAPVVSTHKESSVKTSSKAPPVPKSTPTVTNSPSTSATPQASTNSPCSHSSVKVDLKSLSREDLVSMVKKQRQVAVRYKGRFTDVMEECKKLQQENNKLQVTLLDTQGKSARCVAELKETHDMVNQSKAHLEELFQQQLEEKDEKIKVQSIQIKLLKEAMQQHTEMANEDKTKDKLVEELEGRVTKLECFLNAAQEKVTQVINEKTELEKKLEQSEIDSNSLSEEYQSRIAQLEKSLADGQTDKETALSELEKAHAQAMEEWKAKLEGRGQSSAKEVEQVAKLNEELSKVSQERVSFAEQVEQVKDISAQTVTEMEEKIKTMTDQTESHLRSMEQEKASFQTLLKNNQDQVSELKRQFASCQSDKTTMAEQLQLQEQQLAKLSQKQEMETDKDRIVKNLEEGFVTEYCEKMTELKNKKDVKIVELTKRVEEAVKEREEMAAKLEVAENSLQSAATQHADAVHVMKAQHEETVQEATSQL